MPIWILYTLELLQRYLSHESRDSGGGQTPWPPLFTPMNAASGYFIAMAEFLKNSLEDFGKESLEELPEGFCKHPFLKKIFDSFRRSSWNDF